MVNLRKVALSVSSVLSVCSSVIFLVEVNKYGKVKVKVMRIPIDHSGIHESRWLLFVNLRLFIFEVT